MFLCRLLLGLAEAAFGPGLPFYLSFFFRRDELAFRTGIFISAAPLASSFASTLAYAIVGMGNRTRIQPWRLLFLLEGFPSVFVGVWAWSRIPDSPATARWLTPRERKIATIRLRQKDQEDLNEKTTHNAGMVRRSQFHGLAWREVAKTLGDPKSYLTAAMFFSVNVAFSSMPVFEPMIVKAIGYSALAAQGLSALPHLFAFVVVLLAAWLSDRWRTRSSLIIGAALMALTGFFLLAMSQPMHLPDILRYLTLFPITAGFFTAVTLVIVWTLDNQESAEGKGTGVALLNIIGQIGSLLGGFLYPESHGPYFAVDHAICAGFMLAVAGLALGLRVLLQSKNRSSQSSTAYEMVFAEDEDNDQAEVPKPLQDKTFTYLL